MFVFQKICRALFSWNTRFEIRPFTLLPTTTWKKVSKNRFFFWCHFLVFVLYTEICGVNHRFQSTVKYGPDKTMIWTLFTQCCNAIKQRLVDRLTFQIVLQITRRRRKIKRGITHFSPMFHFSDVFRGYRNRTSN